MLFHGQNMLEFSKANYAPSEFVPDVPNSNYSDEAIFFTNDDRLTNTFRRRFEVVRQWCLDIPEIVNVSVNTPYPGTETWHTEARRITTRDYRLYDIQHAVLPTHLPLPDFYEELVKTQQVLNTKHLGWTALKSTARIAAGHLLRGQTNFVKMLWKFNSVYNPQLQLADHARPVRYQMPLPPKPVAGIAPHLLYIHRGQGRAGRVLDDATEQFVETTRMRGTG